VQDGTKEGRGQVRQPNVQQQQQQQQQRRQQQSATHCAGSLVPQPLCRQQLRQSAIGRWACVMLASTNKTMMSCTTQAQSRLLAQPDVIGQHQDCLPLSSSLLRAPIIHYTLFKQKMNPRGEPLPNRLQWIPTSTHKPTS
jgi:hypothetical protein